MKTPTIVSLITFFGTWLGAHLAYAFVMMDWSTFTEWHPASRGAVLVLAIWLSSTAAGLFHLGGRR